MGDGDSSGIDRTGIDPDAVPHHVGLILDGNGRWANARGLPRTAGHAAGEAALFDVVEGAIELGIRWLSAYTFSTENWARAAEEVEFLMWFNEDLLVRRRDEFDDMGVRMRFAGDLDDPRVPERNRTIMRQAEEKTAGNDTLDLVFAFNYGSRWEITAATRHIAVAVAAGELEADAIDVAVVTANLYIPGMPDVDLVIRSSGEHRLSNFLLWQSAYAELWFPGILWPDFDRHHLADAIRHYQQRDRRFGGTAPTDEP
ncbi:MAG: di-trans,poly-cis-decaprenylcistransferase [Acidimicrobiia bacterium]|nr:di-trans,poly-cis-decaprenylcistransferase [Acidimicrobiia bacterium]